ncbi:MAG: protein-disulfide reductase DsbD domain-containing protein [Fluviicola sp.]
MKIGISSIFFFLCTFVVSAQEYVSWEVSYEADASEIYVAASIEEGWHLYSTEKVSEMGPVPTEIVFEETEGMNVQGKLKEPKPKVSYDPNFGETLYYFEEFVQFSQSVTVNGAESVNGTITYMVCNDEMCMPPVDYKFTIELADEN